MVLALSATDNDLTIIQIQFFKICQNVSPNQYQNGYNNLGRSQVAMTGSAATYFSYRLEQGIKQYNWNPLASVHYQ